MLSFPADTLAAGLPRRARPSTGQVRRRQPLGRNLLSNTHPANRFETPRPPRRAGVPCVDIDLPLCYRDTLAASPTRRARPSTPCRPPPESPSPSAARISLAPLLGAALPGVPGREERQEKYGADTPKADLFRPTPTPSEPLRDTAIVAPRRAFPVLSAPRRASPVVTAPQRSSPNIPCGRGTAACSDLPLCYRRRDKPPPCSRRRGEDPL